MKNYRFNSNLPNQVNKLISKLMSSMKSGTDLAIEISAIISISSNFRDKQLKISESLSLSLSRLPSMDIPMRTKREFILSPVILKVKIQFMSMSIRTITELFSRKTFTINILDLFKGKLIIHT